VGLIFAPTGLVALAIAQRCAALIGRIGPWPVASAGNITAVAGARSEERGIASGVFIAAFQIGSGVILGAVASVFTAHSIHHPGLAAYWWAIATSAATAALATLVCTAAMTRRNPPCSRPVPSPDHAGERR
jgi:MFS family permease